MKRILQVVAVCLTMLCLSVTAFAADYYVIVNNSQQGPVPMEQLQQMAKDGAVSKGSMVWKDGMADWVKAGDQQDLQSLFASSPPQLPPAMPSSAPPSAPPPAPIASNDETIRQSDVNELNNMSDPNTVTSASDDMDDWFQSVLKEFNINDFGEANGKFILNASQSVSLKPIDPQYGDALVNAFDKAMMKLQEKYLMIRFGSTTVDKVKSFYSDRSTDAKIIELPPVETLGFTGKVLKVLEKGLDVSEKKLDQELVEMGVDPSELARMTPTKKKDVFRDKFVKTTLRKASGSIAGLFPIQTNVITDNMGRTVVGVVAIASPKTIQVAKDITLQRKSMIHGKGRDIEKMLPSSDEEYLGTLGVRLAYDNDGVPVIISYGLASYRPDTGDDYINDELKSEAQAAAVSNADAQIAEIINGRMNAKNDRKSGEEVRKFVEREMKADSDNIEKTINNIIKITNNEAKSSAHAKLQGISTVKSWRYTTENGHKFVGAVRVWKYSTLKAVNSFNAPESASGSSTKKSQHFNSSQRSSKKVNTVDDF